MITSITSKRCQKLNNSCWKTKTSWTILKASRRAKRVWVRKRLIRRNWWSAWGRLLMIVTSNPNQRERQWGILYQIVIFSIFTIKALDLEGRACSLINMDGDSLWKMKIYMKMRKWMQVKRQLMIRTIHKKSPILLKKQLIFRRWCLSMIFLNKILILKWVFSNLMKGDQNLNWNQYKNNNQN